MNTKISFLTAAVCCRRIVFPKIINMETPMPKIKEKLIKENGSSCSPSITSFTKKSFMAMATMMQQIRKTIWILRERINSVKKAILKGFKITYARGVIYQIVSAKANKKKANRILWLFFMEIKHIKIKSSAQKYLLNGCFFSNRKMISGFSIG